MAGPSYFSGTMAISQNEDWIIPFLYGTLVNGNFVPIDLTGSVLKWEIRKQEADHEAIVYSQSPDEGIYIVSATGGSFTVLFDRDKLARLAPGDYVTDFVRLMPNGFQERIWEGTATVVEGTTR
jgi:hypothetical protein